MLSIASQSPRTTVARKISLIGGGFLVLVLAAICGVMTTLAAHPAQPALLRGQPYLGRAMLYGRPHITRLQPVRDLQGKVVGALFVAFDLSDFDRSLDQMVSGTRFFDSGGTYVIDPQGSEQG